MRLSVVTASIDPERTRPWWSSWAAKAQGSYRRILVWNTPAPELADPPKSNEWDVVITVPHPTGPVAAFALGIAAAALDSEVIACFHDDLRIDKDGWDQEILYHFRHHPQCGLAGFSGADGLGDADIYRTPYSPWQLARQGFFSNLEDAEKHGRREIKARRSACADGFSQIGRTKFMLPAYSEIKRLGIIHHAFDSMLGMLAHRDGWECYFLPLACKHAGGMTAVDNQKYNEWAAPQGGDKAFWESAHRVFYAQGRGILPFKVKP